MSRKSSNLYCTKVWAPSEMKKLERHFKGTLTLCTQQRPSKVAVNVRLDVNARPLDPGFDRNVSFLVWRKDVVPLRDLGVTGSENPPLPSEKTSSSSALHHE